MVTMLTKKELDVLSMVLQGKTNKEIANEMYNSIRSIEGVKYRLIAKLECKSFYEVIGICFRNKWIE